MAFRLYKANRPEELSERFADEIYTAKRPGTALLAPHIVVVQTRGMTEYLKQVLAARTGIAANLDMPFLNSFINGVFRTLYGAEFRAAELRSAPAAMRRRIFRILGEPGGGDRYPELQCYTAEPNAELKRWQLAGKIADLFDQYQLYRFDRMEELFADVGAGGAWQRRLYEELFGNGQPGRDVFFRRFLEAENIAWNALPPVISVFGVGAMPPVYLRIFLKLAGGLDVNFFYLAPCREYWEFQYSRAEARRRLEPWEAPEPGNPILQALGQLGRGFFTALMLQDESEITEIDDFHDFAAHDGDGSGDIVPDATMLQIMQQDILRMRDRRCCDAGEPEAEWVARPRPELAADNSVAIHDCHSARREIEVLHDEVLNALQTTAIQPRDVIVMAPDLTAYIPAIRAVFGEGPLGDCYSIADVPPPGAALMVEAFHRIWEVAQSRFERSALLALFDLAPVAEKLALEDGDLAKITDWTARADIRWGFDGKMRRRFCAADFDEFSWRMGCDRLLMGWARRAEGDAAEACAQNGIAAVEGVEGAEADLLGKWIGLVEQLAELSEVAAERRSLGAWVEIFERLLKDFFPDGNQARTDLAGLRGALEALRQIADAGDAPGEYPLNAALAMLDDSLENAAEPGGFLRGKITFCRMMPMRSIPMRMVAILGLNEGEFPRRDLRLGFNLVSVRALPGDRSQAVQDRYLLLEALLAARQRLLLFYQGQNTRDDKPRPACAPLTEIAGYLERAFGLREVKHKLSGVDLDYFGVGADPRRRSFDRQNFAAALVLARAGAPGAPNAPNAPAARLPLRLSGMAHENTVELQELIRYFRNPGAWLLAHQLGMAWNDGFDPAAGDDEPWSLEPLARSRLDALLMNSVLGEADPDATYHRADRMNLLPPGAVGRAEFEQRNAAAHELPEMWKIDLAGCERRPWAMEFPETGWRVAGLVPMTPDGRRVLSFRWGKYDARTALPAVLGQLLATVAGGESVEAALLNLNGAGEFEMRFIAPQSPAEAREKLCLLLDWAGRDWMERPPLLLPTASPAFRNPSSAARCFYTANFQTGEVYGDCLEHGVCEYYTRFSWDEPDFQRDFQCCAEMVYGGIQDAGGDA